MGYGLRALLNDVGKLVGNVEDTEKVSDDEKERELNPWPDAHHDRRTQLARAPSQARPSDEGKLASRCRGAGVERHSILYFIDCQRRCGGP